MNEEKIKNLAKAYADSFTYKIDDCGWHEQKERDFTAGYHAALRQHNVIGRSEQCACETSEISDDGKYWQCSKCKRIQSE